MNDKELLKELSLYNLTKETNLSREEKEKVLSDKPESYIKESDMHFYLCELDDLTNTRILFRIFKCVNFMKNVLIAGLVCGGIGIVLAAMK